MKKIAFLFLCFVVLVSFDTQANENDYGIKTIRVHPKVIKPGTEVTVNVLVTGDFTWGNPVVGIYINDEKVIDNREIAESPVSLAPTVSLKFTADDRFLSGDLELKAVMSFEDQKYEILYPNSANKDFCADAPWRVVGEDAAIPVEASIFDGDQWGCNLDWINISDVNNGGAEVAYYDGGGESIDDHRWSYLFDNLIASDFVIVDGYIEMVVQMHYRELIIVPYDFYQYLRVKVTDRNFPRITGWYYGDTHYHSAFTDNFNERGGSFAMIGRCGPAIGLHWTMITDHASNNSGNQWPVGDFANDLEDHEWNALWDSCQAYRTSDFRIIRGEEVTVKNESTIGGDDGTNDNTAHMLTLANSNYIEGPIGPEAYPESGNHSNLKSLTSRLQLMEPMQYGIAYSAHPVDGWIVEVFEDIIPWSSAMYDTALGFSCFKGLELYNERSFYYTNNPDYVNPDEYVNPFPVWQAQAGWDSKLVEGLSTWDSLNCANLNTMRKVFAAGGSDGHGDFNYHYYGLTLLTYSSIEITDNAFGKVRTVVYCPYGMGYYGENVYTALSNGTSIVTDGPFVLLGIDSDGNGSVFGPHDAIMGGTATNPGGGANPKIVVYWQSTEEFGVIDSMRLIVGTPSGTTIYTETIGSYAGYASSDLTPFLPDGEQRFYYRIEAYCPDIEGLPGYRCITNPVWVDLSSFAPNTTRPLTESDRVMDKVFTTGIE